MGVNLDQTIHYLGPKARHAARWWFLLAASVAAALWAGVELYRHYENLLRQERILASLQQATARYPSHKTRLPDPESQRNWNELRQELSFSWYPMFAALERTSKPDIALHEFLPDKIARRLTLRGTSRDIKSLVDYLAALSAEPYFYNVYLSHQKKGMQGNADIVTFEIRMQLRD